MRTGFSDFSDMARPRGLGAENGDRRRIVSLTTHEDSEVGSFQHTLMKTNEFIQT